MGGGADWATLQNIDADSINVSQGKANRAQLLRGVMPVLSGEPQETGQDQVIQLLLLMIQMI